jgi:hypothetical protein
MGLSVLLSLFAPLSVARAGNDDAILQGPDAALTAGAVTATLQDATGVYYNPAGLAHIEQGQVDVSAQAFQLTSLTIDDVLSVVGGPSVDGGILVIPALPAGTTGGGRLEDDLSWGFGIFSANQLAYTLRSSLEFGAPASSISLVSEQIVIDTVAGVGLGWSALPNLRLGVSLTARYRELYGAFLLNGGNVTEDPANPTDSGDLAGFSSSFSRQAVGAGLRVGVQWDPHPNLTLAVAVWTPSFQIYDTRSELGVEIGRFDGSAGETPRTRYTPFRRDASSWGFSPDGGFRIRAGVAYQAAWGWVTVDGDIQTPYADAERRVDRALSWNLRAAVLLRVDASTALGVGFFTDRHAIPPIDDPSSIVQDGNPTFRPRVHLYGGTVGLNFDNTRGLAEDEPSPDIRFRSGIAVRIAYGEGDFSTFALDPGRSFSLQPNVVSASIFEAALYLTAGLYV